MERKDNPNTEHDLLAALADGELDLRDQPDAFAQIAQNAQAAKQIAQHQQLKRAVGKAMDRPEMKCPADLASQLTAMAGQADAPAQTTTQSASKSATQPAPATSASSPGYAGPPVIGRIGRWVPSAVAAVLLIAATVVFIQSGATRTGGNAASLLSVNQVGMFDSRHTDCAAEPGILKQHEQFGDAKDLAQLPGKLGDYFNTSTDGMKLSLSGLGYDYELTGACSLPGNGAVHIVYRHQDDPGRAISLWIKPAGDEHADLKEGQVYSVRGDDQPNSVVFWRQDGLVYYLLGDSTEDCDKAVKELRQAA